MISSCQKDKLGCTTETADNYDQEATTDDGSCIFTTPLPDTYSTSFSVFNEMGNYTCAYVDIILKKNDGNSPTILLNGVSTNEPFSYSGNFQELVELGYEVGDSLKIFVEDCNWTSYDTATNIIPHEGSGNVHIDFSAFVVQ